MDVLLTMVRIFLVSSKYESESLADPLRQDPDLPILSPSQEREVAFTSTLPLMEFFIYFSIGVRSGQVSIKKDDHLRQLDPRRWVRMYSSVEQAM